MLMSFRNKHVNGHVILQPGLMVRKSISGLMFSMQDWIIDSAATIGKEEDVIACA